MHLKSRQHMTRRYVQFTGLWCGITQPGQLPLEPADAWQLYRELGLLARHGLLVGPDTQAFGSQAFPGEQRTGIEFAQRRDIAMADDGVGIDVVTLADVLEQDDQRVDLVFAVGIPEAPGGGVFEARVDDLDTDGARSGLAIRFRPRARRENSRPSAYR